MPGVEPLPQISLPAEASQLLALVEQGMGFVPNSILTMARVPGLFEGVVAISRAVVLGGFVRPELAQMVAHVASTAAGCRYCQAHTVHGANRLGVDEQKLEQLWEFESSEFFDDAERAALRLALHAGTTPNAVSDEDFVALRRHFNDDQIAAIVGVISIFGFLNRWNDTMATALEEGPRSFGDRVLGKRGWTSGKHDSNSDSD